MQMILHQSEEGGGKIRGSLFSCRICPKIFDRSHRSFSISTVLGSGLLVKDAGSFFLTAAGDRISHVQSFWRSQTYNFLPPNKEKY